MYDADCDVVEYCRDEQPVGEYVLRPMIWKRLVVGARPTRGAVPLEPK